MDDVSLDVSAGEVLAIVGENGAGKSTLMNVLYGLHRPDAGEIHVRGARVTIRSPRDALRLGIGMVHQHFMLVPRLTVAENVVLGREPRRRGLLDLRRAEEEVAATAKRFGFALDPRARVEDLGVGAQQKVEIVKALHRGAEVLILDEPTAVLSPQEADELHEVTRGLAAAGRTVIFISHKLREVLQVAQRIAVMRRGRKVAEVAPAETTPAALAELIVGERLQAEAAAARKIADRPRLRLEVKAVSADRAAFGAGLHGVSLKAAGGEIVGIAGVDGNGQRELVEILTGLRRGTGSIQLQGKELLGRSPGELRALGVGHVPEDRQLRAIVPEMSVEENLALGRHRHPPFARGPFIDFGGRRRHALALAEEYDVRPRDPLLRLRALSGGNQQKVVLARELDARPLVLVAAQPTRGLDAAAVAAIHRRLLVHRDAGAAVLLVSLDLEEVLALSDRVYVLCEGRVAGEAARGAYDERQIGRWMLGAARA